MSSADPIATLCAELKRCGLDIKPADLSERLNRIGVRVEDHASRHDAHVAWERGMVDGTLVQGTTTGG